MAVRWPCWWILVWYVVVDAKGLVVDTGRGPNLAWLEPLYMAVDAPRGYCFELFGFSIPTKTTPNITMISIPTYFKYQIPKYI